MKKKLKQLNKFDNPSLATFLISGFLTGILVLVISVITNSFGEDLLKLSSNDNYRIVFLVLIEELIRFSALNFLYSAKANFRVSDLTRAFSFGLGFATFELLLVYFNSGILNLVSVSSSVSLHSLVSIIIFSSVFYKNKSRIFSSLLLFLVALVIHSIYNLVIHIYIY